MRQKTEGESPQDGGVTTPGTPPGPPPGLTPGPLPGTPPSRRGRDKGKGLPFDSITTLFVFHQAGTLEEESPGIGDDEGDSNGKASHTRRQGRRILDQLESYRSSDGTFTFKLSWPGSTYDGGAAPDQVWKQTLNPVGAGQSLTTPVMGYEAVSVPYPAACGKPLHRASAAAQHEGGLAQDQLQLSAMSELAGSPDEARLNNLGDVWAGLGAVLEPCWAVLGVLGQSWGCPRALLRPSWSVLGVF